MRYLLASYIWNLHIGRMHTCLVFKNYPMGLSCNAFDRQYHGMIISGGNYITVAHNLGDKAAGMAWLMSSGM